MPIPKPRGYNLAGAIRCKAAGHLAHGLCHADSPFGRVRHGHGVVEENHHAVPGEALESPFVVQDEPPHLGLILSQDSHDLLRIGHLSERRETAQIEKDHRDFASMTVEGVGRPHLR